MMKVLTTTAMMAKPSRTDEMMEMNWSKSPWSSAILVSAVTTSSSASAKAAAASLCSAGMASRNERNCSLATSRADWMAAITSAGSAPGSRMMVISS